MNDIKRIQISENLEIPAHELRYRYARSGGPGGQHVNRTASRVELIWDVRNSPSLSKTQRHRIEQALSTRLDKEGVLHLTASERRSQLQNKHAVTERFAALLREAIKPHKKRIPTIPSKSARERRLQEKRRHSAKKQMRRAALDE
jgi:ribosome-associated protein